MDMEERRDRMFQRNLVGWNGEIICASIGVSPEELKRFIDHGVDNSGGKVREAVDRWLLGTPNLVDALENRLAVKGDQAEVIIRRFETAMEIYRGFTEKNIRLWQMLAASDDPDEAKSLVEIGLVLSRNAAEANNAIWRLLQEAARTEGGA